MGKGDKEHDAIMAKAHEARARCIKEAGEQSCVVEGQEPQEGDMLYMHVDGKRVMVLRTEVIWNGSRTAWVNALVCTVPNGATYSELTIEPYALTWEATEG